MSLRQSKSIHGGRMKNWQIMTTKELADYIKLNEKTVLKMAQQGHIPGIKIGNQWRFHPLVIDRYLQNQLMQSSDEELNSIIRTKENVIPISRLTNEALIDLDVRAKNKKQALSALADIAFQAGLTSSYENLYAALKKREEMLSTAVGQGVAISHPRHPMDLLFSEPRIVIARIPLGVHFDAPDGQKVCLIFMPCAPTDFAHIRLIAKISKLLHVPGNIERLKDAQAKEEVMRILLAFDQRQILPVQDQSDTRSKKEK